MDERPLATHHVDVYERPLSTHHVDVYERPLATHHVDVYEHDEGCLIIICDDGGVDLLCIIYVIVR